MGSWASGNHRRERRQTTDELPSIHVRDLANPLRSPGAWTYIPYFEVHRLRVQVINDTVIFGAVVGNAVIAVAEFDLVYSARHVGGQQTYFQCQCGKRATTLYMADNGIACRLCHGLLYESQFTPTHEQPAAKAARLRAKLGGPPALLQPVPERPKGMHRETYDRISYQILHYEVAAAQELERYREERWLPVLLKMDELEAQL